MVSWIDGLRVAAYHRSPVYAASPYKREALERRNGAGGRSGKNRVLGPRPAGQVLGCARVDTDAWTNDARVRWQYVLH